MARLALFVAVGLLVPVRASANSCEPLKPQIHPGWAMAGTYDVLASPPPPVAVGRLCTVELYTPAEGCCGRLVPDDLVFTSSGGEIIMAVSSAAERVMVDRSFGCGGVTAEIRAVAYDRHILTPMEPLPASREIRISRRNWTTSLVTFATSDRLDMENCGVRPGPPRPPHCSPPTQDCQDGGAGGADGGNDGETRRGGCTLAGSRSQDEGGRCLAGLSILAGTVLTSRARRRQCMHPR